MVDVRKPYNDKNDLMKNLGARRAQLQEQKIAPLLQEFEMEITENIVLQDLKLTRLFKDFVEYYNDYLDTVEEAYNQLVTIIMQTIQVTEEHYVPREEFERLREAYENREYAEEEEPEEEVKKTKGRGSGLVSKKIVLEPDEQPVDAAAQMNMELERNKFAKKLDNLIKLAISEGKNIAKMKQALRYKLVITKQWQRTMIDDMVDDAVVALGGESELPVSKAKPQKPEVQEEVSEDENDEPEEDEGEPDEAEG